MSKRKVIFRADGNSSIGLGHVVRSCALADMIHEDFDCYFSIRNPSSFIKNDILKYGLKIEQLDDLISYPEEAEQWSKQLKGDEIIVLDGYHFDTSYQQTIKSRGCKLVCIDDIHAYHFVADAVINFSGGITEEDYSKESYTNLFLGPRYALLRKEFLIGSLNSSKEKKYDILICFGGADPSNATVECVKFIDEIEAHRTIHIVIGGNYSYKDELTEEIRNSKHDIILHEKLSAKELCCLMAKCIIAFTSPSTIAWEYIAITGNLYLKITADNQINIYNYLLQEGCALPLTSYPEVIPNIIFNQQRVLDKKSPARVRNIFQQI